MHALTSDSPDINGNDYVMAKNMADALHKAYPGHLWAVTCNGKTGMADVRNLMLSGNWGFRLRLPLFYSASAFEKDVVKAGGELLERFRVRRGRADFDALNNLPTDFAGRVKADHD